MGYVIKCSNMRRLIFLWITYCIIAFVNARGPACCSNINLESCRSSCEQFHEQSQSIPRMQVLLSAAEYCAPSLTSFWNCINTTLPAVRLMSKWPGKMCCEMAATRECQRRCHSANTKEIMEKHCRKRDEPSVYSCIKRQEDADRCCTKAQVTSCRLVCHAVHLTPPGNLRHMRELVSQHCKKRDHEVEKCVNKMWQPVARVSTNYTPCCVAGKTEKCRKKCKELFKRQLSEQEILEELMDVCSQPTLTEPLWQCMLSKNKKTHKEAPIASVDNAKLQCCGRGRGEKCRELCRKTYQNGWTYNAEFDTSCSYMPPVTNREVEMHNCLSDVDRPCKLGCSGLKFCSNFNNRPSEMFRSCNKESDRAAMRTFETWKKGVIKLPQIDIFVKDISKCNPSMWKAVACALEVKPCSSNQEPVTLCKKDCLTLLSQCADPSRYRDILKTVPMLCDSLPSNGACLSLKPFLKQSRSIILPGEINQPCEPNPCLEGEVCQIRQKKCRRHSNCLSYVCHSACPLGENSKILVPKSTFLRLMDPNQNIGGNERSYMSCQCSHRKKLEGCQPLYKITQSRCHLGHNSVKVNGESFTMDGRSCVCIAGEVACSRTSCQPDAYSPLYTGMPGNCPLRYSPVCAANGKTYPNNCIAACVGVSKTVPQKACSDIDMCATKPCPHGSKCVPRPQVCINDMESINSYCPQYECVDDRGDCDPHLHDPVCDSKDQEYKSMCYLNLHHRTLAYRGHCQSSCSKSGVVCGHDGETYSSECAARAAGITVDYRSKCVAFGNLTKKSKPMSCSRVECSPLNPKDCRGVIPPGGCCPICGAVMVLLWNPKLLSATAENLRSQIVTTGDIVKTLSTLLSISGCGVYGYASVNYELVILVTATSSQHSTIQVETCLGEAKRLHNLWKTESPTIVSYLILSPFAMASMDISTISSLSHSQTVKRQSNHNSTYTFPSGNHSISSFYVSNVTLWLIILTITLMHRKWVLRL